MEQAAITSGRRVGANVQQRVALRPARYCRLLQACSASPTPTTSTPHTNPRRSTSRSSSTSCLAQSCPSFRDCTRTRPTLPSTPFSLSPTLFRLLHRQRPTPAPSRLRLCRSPWWHPSRGRSSCTCSATVESVSSRVLLTRCVSTEAEQSAEGGARGDGAQERGPAASSPAHTPKTIADIQATSTTSPRRGPTSRHCCGTISKRSRVRGAPCQHERTRV
jgi:hypothetical protein